MKLERRHKNKPQIVIHNEKNNRTEKYFNFLRKRVTRRFGVPDDIPITTEDCGDLYFEIPLAIRDGNLTKEVAMTITRKEINMLLGHPKVREKLNIKKILGYYCVLFNEKDSFEFIASFVYRVLNVNTEHISIPQKIIDSDITKPFIFIYNLWDNSVFLDKYMDTGKDDKKLGNQHIKEHIKELFDAKELARPLRRWELIDNDEPIDEGIPN